MVCLACAMVAWAIDPAYLLDIAALAAGGYAIYGIRAVRAQGYVFASAQSWFRLVGGLALVVLHVLVLAGVIELSAS